MKIVKWTLIFIGSLIGLMLIFAGIAYYLITQPPAIKEEMRPVEVSAEAARSLEQKLEAFQQEVQQAAQAGEQKEVRLEITEEELNAKINEYLKELAAREELSIDVEDVQVNVKDGKLLLAGEAEVSGVKVQGGVEASVKTEDGRVKLEINRVDLGRFPLPSNVKEKVMNLIPEEKTTIELENLPLGLEENLPVKLKNLRLEDGKLLIEGVTK
ncbi:MAG: hypothetical protein DRI26_01195 [Chloroflexi bacterium]|nr:MAG: hypothetical protein DRI26_01195 [Chloroflexota bacterium]